MDPLLLIGLAVVLAALILSVPYIQKLTRKSDPIQQQQPNAADDAVVAGVGRRNRGRRNVRRHPDEDEEDEQAVAVGKVGTKKMRKLQAKADRKVMREQEEALREDEKRRKELRDKERKERDEADIAQQQKEEEKALELKAKEEQREHEEYLKLKESFIVEEEGLNEMRDEEKTLNDFILYIKENKVVFLEDLAAEFSMRTQDIIERIHCLQQNGQLTGVVDDRGKFIFISLEEMRAVAKFIKQRGRVSISELAQSSNNLITLQ